MTEGIKIIIKPEIPVMSWVMAEKNTNKEGSAHKVSMIKWKWFIQEYAAGGNARRHPLNPLAASFPLTNFGAIRGAARTYCHVGSAL